MNKNELISKVKDNIDIEVSKKDLDTIICGTFDTIKNTLASGEKIAIAGFGSFESVERAERVARNPRTGEEMTIPKYKAPKFKASSVLKSAINA